jgi:uncharacterized protein (TIGR03382 family)
MPDAQGESGAAGQGVSRRGLSQPAHVLLLLGVLIAGFFNDATHGWGAPITASVFVLLGLVLSWRRCWNRVSFWAAVALMSAAQVPLVIFARPKIEQNRLYMLAFMVVDFFLVATAITFVAQLDPNSPLNTRNYSSQREQSK